MKWLRRLWCWLRRYPTPREVPESPALRAAREQVEALERRLRQYELEESLIRRRVSYPHVRPRQLD